MTDFTRICSKHFLPTDFIEYEAQRRRLKSDSIPSVFAWSKQKKRKSPKKRYDSEETDTASETEDSGDLNLHKYVQADLPFPCSHSFSITNIAFSNPKLKLMQFYTGFQNYDIFKNVLELIVPNQDRSNIFYWDSRATGVYMCGTDIFDSDEPQEVDSDDSDDDVTQPTRTHRLSVEDEFLLTMIKLKLGLFNKDLATRFNISLSTVTKIFKTWINTIYLRLGSMKLFPHRDVITQNMTKDFQKQYPCTMLIIDCTELKIEMPSSLIRKSQTYSDDKSSNTYKGLIGVDSRGGIMFISHLYTGGISDKEICQRSGLYDLLRKKIGTGELKAGDAIMADKGFTISKELEEIGLRLNIPPFLGKRKQMGASDVKETQLIVHHRIHVERAIGKVKGFHIVDRKFRIKQAGIVNQIWTDCCLLANFQDPLIIQGSSEGD